MIKDATDLGYKNRSDLLNVGKTLAKNKHIPWTPEKSNEIDSKHKVHAYINYGRWVANCCFCRGAELVFKDDPYFVCLSCFNSTIGYKKIEVIFPKDIEKIEAALNKRIEAKNQNWLPHETIADLEKENIAHGVI